MSNFVFTVISVIVGFYGLAFLFSLWAALFISGPSDKM